MNESVARARALYFEGIPEISGFPDRDSFPEAHALSIGGDGDRKDRSPALEIRIRGG